MYFSGAYMYFSGAYMYFSDAYMYFSDAYMYFFAFTSYQKRCLVFSLYYKVFVNFALLPDFNRKLYFDHLTKKSFILTTSLKESFVLTT